MKLVVCGGNRVGGAAVGVDFPGVRSTFLRDEGRRREKDPF